MKENKNKSKKKSETQVLDEITKGIKMGMDSISSVAEKIDDDKFKNALLDQYNGYNELLNRVDNKVQEFGNFPKDIPPMQKTMAHMEVKMNTAVDDSVSHIAEMMLQGTNMGIIKGIKLLHEGNDISNETHDILCDFVDYQENCVEALKKYL